MKFPKTLFKDLLREIWKTKGRFLAVLMIVALGTGFFAGLKVACADIKLTASTYYADTNLMDFRLTSTYGVTREDAAALAGREDVAEVMAGYSADLFGNLGSNGDFVVKVLAFEGSHMNRLVVKEGRLPEASGECVVERKGAVTGNAELGDVLTFSPGGEEKISDTLKREAYTVVGIVESPLYISDQRGMSTIGDGTADCFAVIPPEDFALEVYTDAYITLKDTRGLNAYTLEYDNLIQGKTEELETFAARRGILRYQEITGEANGEIADAQRELAEGEAELSEQLGKAWRKLEDAKKELGSGEGELKKGRAELARNRRVAQAEFAVAEQKLTEGEEEYEATLSLYEQNRTEAEAGLPGAQAELEQLAVAIGELEAAIAGLEQEDPASPLLEGMGAQLLAFREQYAAGMARVSEIQQGLAAMEQGLAAARAELDRGWRELGENREVLERRMRQGEAALNKAERELKAGRVEYEEGIAEYRFEKQKAEREIADAREEIAEAEAKVADIEWPKWYVFSREDNPGYAQYGVNAESVDQISLVFPVFFILTAILVCLTTMTRMVEERRVQIGTMKALGYSRGTILMKYLLYAFAASFLGSVAGVLIGFKVFPWAAFMAFRMTFIMPPVIMPFHWDYAILCTLVAVTATLAATYASGYRELSLCPASLMRPKSPKAGRRLLIERMGAFWKRTSFAYKVTLRNLFRYKKRAMMTIVGIAGCTALMLAGFGLRYAITSVVPVQFGEIFLYDGVVAEKEDLSQGQRAELHRQIRQDSQITGALPVYQASTKAETAVGSWDVMLVVPGETEELETYLTLREPETGAAIDLVEAETVLNQKLATLLGLEAGMEFQLQIHDRPLTLRVGAVTENYLGNFVYVSPDYYAEQAGKQPPCNGLFFNLEPEADAGAVSAALVGNDNVTGVSLTADSKRAMEDAMDNLGLVVVVIILCAGVLAVVVLYNLMNINISERTRELATIKVLGFRQRETAAYLYRENVFCTVLGIGIGLLLGTLLEQFILAALQVENMMFIPNIDFLSYIYATALTLCFALLVNVFFYFRLKRLSMVESMKSVE